MIFFKQKAKVFCIGANKTGTTSLAKLFQNLGYKVAPQKKQESYLENIYYSNKTNEVKKFVKNYDFFQDIPFSLEYFYIKIDTLFPNSKFILTIRDAELWYESLCNFHLKIINKKLNKKITHINLVKKEDLKNIAWIHNEYKYNLIRKVHIYTFDNSKLLEDWNLLYDKKSYIDYYNNRNLNIIKYFQDRKKDLLIIDLSKEKDSKKINEFLDIKGTVLQIPHLNKS